MAFCEIDENIKIAEELLKYLVNFVISECMEDFDLFSRFVDKDLRKNLESLSRTETSIKTLQRLTERFLLDKRRQ